MKAAIIMGSKSDAPVLKDAIKTFSDFGVETSVRVLSAHRTPEEAARFAQTAKDEGFDVIIAAAGKAAHLAGAMAAHSVLPVIGIPVKSSALDGLDALLSTVQMPPGIPVATVGIDAAKNAALMAIRIMAIKYPELYQKLLEYKESMRRNILDSDKDLQNELEGTF